MGKRYGICKMNKESGLDKEDITWRDKYCAV